MAKNKVIKILTLSKYDSGMHHFDDNGEGEPSFFESLVPLHFMINDLYKKGTKLKSKIKVTMEDVSKRKNK